ncbi:keratin-associated protein 5-3-like [Erpetoichthys calabaricus]|uniref:keratin-associated protein 5-3-like n=1 Tax=Erpetoichthys calabaricus TaxID=27687 RepID=UPI002234DC34|nr:keratin-associated protein 5-3-like [Erpetoichthys calabaricus]
MWGIMKFIAALLLTTTLVVSEFTTTTPPELIPGKNSCNGVCNQAIEYCSCEASCSLNNNCCLDFCSYCYEVNADFCDSTTDNGIPGFNICMGQCGRTSGPCSCHPSCAESGNCCPTFCDFCSYMDTGYCQVPTSVTDPGSCNGLCYGSTGSCSCDSSCVDNGNCCPDFCYYCQSLSYGFCQFVITTTTAFTTTTTAGFNMCMGQCGRTSGPCSCDPSCVESGNCCSTFCDFCSYMDTGYCQVLTPVTAYLNDIFIPLSTIGYTSQGGGDSCNGLCSSFAADCSCEYSCVNNGNCCPDFCDFCSYVNFGYCEQSTSAAMISTVPTIGYTAQGGGDSCNGLCSSFASNCSCEYSCGYNDNCCPDFCDFCPYVNFGYCEQSTVIPSPTLGMLFFYRIREPNISDLKLNSEL